MGIKIRNSARACLAGGLVGAAAIVALLKPATVEAGGPGWHGCTTKECPGEAECKGDYFLDNGGCKITCYVLDGETGQITQNGTAGCSTKAS